MDRGTVKVSNLYGGLYKTIDNSNDVVKAYLAKFPDAELDVAVGFAIEAVSDALVVTDDLHAIESNWAIAEETAMQKLA